MEEPNKTPLVHLTETAMQNFLRPINTAVVEPQNESKGAGEPTVTYYRKLQMPVKH